MCIQCSDADTCTECDSDNGFYLKDNTCYACNETISNCLMCEVNENINAVICLVCQDGTYLNYDASSCV